MLLFSGTEIKRITVKRYLGCEVGRTNYIMSLFYDETIRTCTFIFDLSVLCLNILHLPLEESEVFNIPAVRHSHQAPLVLCAIRASSASL